MNFYMFFYKRYFLVCLSPKTFKLGIFTFLNMNKTTITLLKLFRVQKTNDFKK